MSMVSGIPQSSFPSAVQGTRAEQLERQDRIEGPAETAPKGGEQESVRDEYVHGEEPISAGLYQLSKDENGAPKVIFDSPQQDIPETAPPTEGADGGKESEDRCTVNTDHVDAEIERLKEKKAELEQQLAQAKDNPEEKEQLQAQLQQVMQDLGMKGNETYRRQHAEYTHS